VFDKIHLSDLLVLAPTCALVGWLAEILISLCNRCPPIFQDYCSECAWVGGGASFGQGCCRGSLQHVLCWMNAILLL